MIDSLTSALSEALAFDGVWLLLFGTVLAGLVRGFSGFGTALIYMPFAGTVLPPVYALATMLIFEVPGTLPLVPRSLRDCHRRDVVRLAFGAVLGLPLGLYLLVRIEPDVFRWSVSITALILLGLLVTGWRYHGVISHKMTTGIGGLGGVLAGASGLAGPPVIMLYMSSRHAVSAIRANIFLYLFLTDIVSLLMLAIVGKLDHTPLILGLLLIIPYGLANIVGAALFRPDQEKLFRAVAYGLIAFSALSNLPFIR
jgi:uncharacterized membrane protein YfcA